MSSSVSLACVGDVRVQRDDPPSMFASVKSILRSCDGGVLGNLEGPLCDRGAPIWKPRPGSAFHRAEPRQVAGLVDAGFSYGSLANNCTMNYGVEGMAQTIEVLNAAGIKHSGAGMNLEQAHAPAVIERGGVRIGVLSYTTIYVRNAGIWEATADRPGLATIEVTTSYEPGYRYFEHPGDPMVIHTEVTEGAAKRVKSDIRALKEKVDWVLIAWHWGDSGAEWINGTIPAPRRHTGVMSYQEELGRMSIDAGADVVFGHHPHALQPVELYKGGVICYSLGNFAVEHMNPHAGRESAIVQLTGDKDGIRDVRVHPVWLDDGSEPLPVKLTSDHGKAAAALLRGFGDSPLEDDRGSEALRLTIPRKQHA